MRRCCVLIVDDTDDVRELLRLAVTWAGFDAITADNGLQALDRIRERRPCAILLDIQMPVMDGFQFRAYQLRDPELARIPVIGLTAAFEPHQAAARLGTQCFGKPIDFDALSAQLEAVCAECHCRITGARRPKSTWRSIGRTS